MHSPYDREIGQAAAERGEQIYKVQAGCWSCLHRFELKEFDGDRQLYCNRTKDRPKPCGSVEMGESFYFGDFSSLRQVSRDQAAAYRKAWCDWRDGKEVREAGICNMYLHDPRLVEEAVFGKIGDPHLVEAKPCSVPTDPGQKLDITCAVCGMPIDFRKGEVYVNGPSYVCHRHSHDG
jgi:hypothetical protein